MKMLPRLPNAGDCTPTPFTKVNYWEVSWSIGRRTGRRNWRSPIVTTIRLLSAGLETIDDQIVEIFPGDSDVSPSISKSVRPLFPPSYS